MKTYADARGEIIDFENGVQQIDTFAGKVRANHYHLTSGHDCYFTKGAIYYYERPANSKEPPLKLRVSAPAVVSTGPMMEHTMAFIEDTTFICVRTGGSYTSEEYEKDIVRFDHNLADECWVKGEGSFDY